MRVVRLDHAALVCVDPDTRLLLTTYKPRDNIPSLDQYLDACDHGVVWLRNDDKVLWDDSIVCTINTVYVIREHITVYNINIDVRSLAVIDKQFADAIVGYLSGKYPVFPSSIDGISSSYIAECIMDHCTHYNALFGKIGTVEDLNSAAAQYLSLKDAWCLYHEMLNHSLLVEYDDEDMSHE